MGGRPGATAHPRPRHRGRRLLRELGLRQLRRRREPPCRARLPQHPPLRRGPPRLGRGGPAARGRTRLTQTRASCEHTFVVDDATILHADLDAFYASVEQRDDPRLRGRPVIVGAGVVLAASYEAKRCGIRTAMGGRIARRLCPHAIVVRPRMSAYAEASRDVYRVFEDTAPKVEGLSIDEAFLDVRGMERISGTPVEIARKLRRDVL